MLPIRLLRALFRRGAPCAFLLLLLFLVRPAVARAEVSVSGTVTDEQSHQPVVGALVGVVGTSIHVSTDESGHFTVTAPRAITRLVISRLGYARRVVDVTDPAAALAVELEVSALPMESVEVTGTALPKEDLDRPQATGTLTPRDLKRGNGLELESAINEIPGVLMQSRTPFGGAHIQIRGYYPNFSQNSNGFGYQLFLEEIPVTDATGQTILDDVDFTSLGQVEVIKGPTSSRYGSQIGGAVNFYTARPNAGEQTLAQQLVGGNDGLFRTNTTFASGGEHSTVVMNYGHQTYDSFRPNSRSKKDYARFTGDFEAGPRQKISAYFSYNNSYEQLAGELDSLDFYNRQAIDNPVYLANASKIAIESQRLGFTHAYHFCDDLDARTTLFSTTQTMSQPFAHGFNDYNRFSFGARSALGIRADAGPSVQLDGSVGGLFQRTNYTVNGFFLPARRPSDQENYGMNYYAFTEWNAHFPADVVLTAGAALNFNEFGVRNMLKNNVVNDTTKVYRRSFDPRFTPHAALLKKFNDAVSVYGSVASGYTPPSLASFLNSDNTINKDLKPETAVQYELGSKGQLLGQRLSYGLAVFDLEIKDKLVSQRIGAITSTTNAGKQRNRGLEVELSHVLVDQPEGWLTLVRPRISYTYSDFKYVDFKSDANHNASTVDFSGKRVARVPRNVFNVGLDADTHAGLSLYASFQHVDKAYVTFNNSNIVKPYNLLGAKLNYERRLGGGFTLNAAAGGDNLLGQTYYKFIFIGPNIGGLAWPKDGGTGDGYILPGPYDATFYGDAKLTYSF